MNDFREIPFARPWITDADRQAVVGVLDGHILTHGPECKAFEKEFSEFLGGETYCVTVSSCMAALHLAYLHFGIGAGDEVIVPAQTHTATAHAVEWVGAKPVFLDCDPRTGNVTADSIRRAISKKTKAVSVVHFLGIPCEMHEIMAVADKHGLKVIEDCAIALGTRYHNKHAGLFGDAGCFSFYPVKHITTGEGGMFVSKHRPVAEAVQKLRAFGVDRKHSERRVAGLYDVPTLGLNYRMSELQAALGRSQLKRVEENLRRRSDNFCRLKAGLSGAPGIAILDAQERGATSSHYCLSAVIGNTPGFDRNKIVENLNAAGVGTSVYYPQPVPRLTFYKQKYGYTRQDYCCAENISDKSVALPVGPHLAVQDVEYIARAFVRALEA